MRSGHATRHAAVHSNRWSGWVTNAIRWGFVVAKKRMFLVDGSNHAFRDRNPARSKGSVALAGVKAIGFKVEQVVADVGGRGDKRKR